ncbi:MAG: glycosyltransferase family 39 protein [Isosphaeraceae bacterium]|nr:glycosyltransferase family 39 protein [Isosphaeraceae bacterium]
MTRRALLAIVLLAAVLHSIGIARTLLPAQDGLKFLRVARQFHHQPWTDVVRGTDQHPLYPALIALAEPVVRAVLGRGPATWRIAAQLVSAGASVALLFPLFGLIRALFDERIACVGTLAYVLLPFPAAVGHDTLSDSLALLAFLVALRVGEVALRRDGWFPAVGCGLAAGVGYLARPEVLVVPAAVLLTAATRWRMPAEARQRLVPRLAALTVVFLATVGSYTLVKGEVSEKLALRIGAALGKRPAITRKTPQWLPRGLNDPRWDFSPKEEAEDAPQTKPLRIVGRLAQQWGEGLGWIFAFFALWGVARDRFIRRFIRRDEDPEANVGRRLIAMYLALFSAVLVRHAWKMGYLSGRHTLTLVVVSVPWAAAGTTICACRLASVLRWGPRLARGVGVATLLAAVAASALFQLKPSHPTRWGHWAAGRWLAAHARPADAVLDTRGWAAFVSGRSSYDYWHVRQAFTDDHLAYIVVGTDELEAESRRGATLRAVLAYAAEPVAAFPEIRGGEGTGVQVFYYRRPASWEGLRP